MSLRDRLVLIGVIAVAVVGVVWLMFVSPERKKAHTAAAARAAAEAQLSSAHSELVTARAAQAKYAASYGTIVHLGKAVPTTQEVPSLMYELAQASKQKSVEFTSISSSDAGKGAVGSSGTSSTGGFQQMPFTFVFNGTYSGLEHMLRQLTNFATKTPSGALKVNGRLLTIQGVALQPLTLPGKSNSNPHLTATVTASAYVLPPEPASTGSTSAGGATPASTGGGSGSGSSSTSSSAPPAVIGARP
jgi:Tfp pilus assembly protein PilO